MSPLVVVVAVLAGGIGAVARYFISRAVVRRPFPWAVLIVNVIGSAVAGVVLALTDGAPDAELRLVILGGFAGGLTTFSTFAVESMQLAVSRRRRDLWVSAVANCAGGLVALGMAWLITKALLGVL
jgi:fluoride exporter